MSLRSVQSLHLHLILSKMFLDLFKVIISYRTHYQVDHSEWQVCSAEFQIEPASINEQSEDDLLPLSFSLLIQVISLL